MNLSASGFVLDQVPAGTSAALAKLVARINQVFSTEHLPDGHHGFIKCQGLMVGGAQLGADQAVLTPSTLTADTHDFNPPGLGTAHFLRLSADGNVNLTGIAVPNPAFAWEYRLANVAGTGDITLKHYTAPSAALNRFATPSGADFVLGEQDGAHIWYDPVSRLWRVQGI